MNLGLEGLIESKEETSSLNDIEYQVLEADVALQELFTAEENFSNIEEIACVIKEHGYGPALEQLFGSELSEYGISTDTDADVIVAKLEQVMEVSEEAVLNILTTSNY